MRQGVVQAASVNIVMRNSIDTPLHKTGMFCFAHTVLDNLCIDWYPKQIYTKCVKKGRFHQEVFALRELKLSPKHCMIVHVSYVLLTELGE